MSVRCASRAAFTLIELMVSTALAMLIAGLTLTAFQQTRRTINRAEVLIALNDEAQAIYLLLEKSFASVQQSCALVAHAEARAVPAPASAADETGTVTLIFMSALEQKDNYQTGSTSGNTLYQTWQTWDRSHLCWEGWRWQRSTGTLHLGRSRPMRRNLWEEDTRSFTIANAPDRPASPQVPFRPAGGTSVNYYGSTFRTVVQPRRHLDPIHPFGGPDPLDPTVSRLDDNMWFPDTAAPGYPDPDPLRRRTKSLLDDVAAYKITEDVGDYSDLQTALRTPMFENVTDLCWELIPHDESLASARIDDGASGPPPATPLVWQGVWLDGRLGSGPSASLVPPQVFAGSDAARRPKLVRLRFTLTHARTGVSQTFSFSFSLPGLAPQQ